MTEPPAQVWRCPRHGEQASAHRDEHETTCPEWGCGEPLKKYVPEQQLGTYVIEAMRGAVEQARVQAFEDFCAQLTSDEAAQALREAFNEKTEGNYVPHEPMARAVLQAAKETIKP